MEGVSLKAVRILTQKLLGNGVVLWTYENEEHSFSSKSICLDVEERIYNIFYKLNKRYRKEYITFFIC